MVHASEGRWRLVEPYPGFDIMDKRRSNDGKKNGIILKESSASQRKKIRLISGVISTADVKQWKQTSVTMIPNPNKSL